MIIDHDNNHQYDYHPPAALYVPGSDGKPCHRFPHPGYHKIIDGDGDGDRYDTEQNDNFVFFIQVILEIFMTS